MASGYVMGDRQRASGAIAPPEGATLASFVFFASVATLAAIVYVGGEWWNLAGGLGFPSDAAWVRAAFARNVASGEGLCFNPGTPVAGAAAPAWIASLAAAGFVTGNFLVSAKLLGTACVVLTAFLAWLVILDLLGDWRFAFVGGLLVAASPRLAAAGLSGTEAPLAGLLALAAIHRQGRGWEATPERRALGAVAAGLAALCRPELLLLVPLLLVDRWLTAGADTRPRAGRPGRRLPGGLLEFGAAALALAPYLLYNWRLGGPLWQQPERALQAQPAWLWAETALALLCRDSPLLLCAAAIGLPVAVLGAARPECQHRSFLVALAPMVMVVAPGLIWRQAGPENAAYTAAYLTPVIAILGACGLFAVHRAGRRWIGEKVAAASGGAGASSCRTGGVATRMSLLRASSGVGIGLVCAALAWFALAAHREMWREHGFGVKKVSYVQGEIGRWAGDHSPVDASIASREVGAIGFFSRRRMVDLGGTISQEGLRYLSRPGAPDSNLLAYLEKARPSHLAIRPADFPDLAQRADLLRPAVTCAASDPTTGGLRTMTLYETPWPPPSVRAARSEAEAH